ncbi:MAG: ABC-F family ATP-binding cassette domain-containing protein [Oligoflexales bacterium]|nr:ABC-F family ATP-binding cassette domain-containing protein [Oligoflexales bacterium]
MIRIENLVKTFGNKTLLRGASFHFPNGEKIALIGDNGAGKSTLLNMMTDLEAPNEGSILRPQKLSLGYLPQEPNSNPKPTVIEECETGNEHLVNLKVKMDAAIKKMETDHEESSIQAYEAAETAYKSAGGYGLRAKASSILSGLGFSPEVLEQSPLNLSGGWRMRLELAKLFIKNPDFLILDEPTNHLDLPSLVWVENYLKSFAGTLLFVSHDKTLLNRLASITLHLSQGKLIPYKGNYDKFVAASTLRQDQDAATRAQLHRRKEELESFVKRFGAKATKAKQAQSRVKMIARLEEEEAQIPEEVSESTLAFALPEPEKSDRILFNVEDGSIGYKQALSQGIKLQVERGHKIAVIGANGIGKSTFLKTIIGKIAALDGKFTSSTRTSMAYFAQDQLETLDPELSIFENIQKNSEWGQKEIRSLLGSFLFSGDDVFKQVKVLSGGEKSRVGLANILSRKSNLLLLDEPTNHLDMKSAESLTAALNSYKGTMIFVSHDRELIDRVCSHVFAMLPDGRSMLFEGNLDDYAKLAMVAGFPNVLDTNNESAESQKTTLEKKEEPSDQEDFKELKRKRAKLEKDISKLEKSIEKLKHSISQIEQSMSTLNPDDYTAMNAKHQEHQELKVRLEDEETEWLECYDELEGILGSLKAMGRL